MHISSHFLILFREGISHFLEGEQQERIMSYLPLSNIGVAVGITKLHPKISSGSLHFGPVCIVHVDHPCDKRNPNPPISQADSNYSCQLQSRSLAQFFVIPLEVWMHHNASPELAGFEVTCYFAGPYDMKAGNLKDRLCAYLPTLMLAMPLVWEKNLHSSRVFFLLLSTVDGLESVCICLYE